MHFHFVWFIDIEMVQVYESPNMAADGLVMQGARASTGMVLTLDCIASWPPGKGYVNVREPSYLGLTRSIS